MKAWAQYTRSNSLCKKYVDNGSVHSRLMHWRVALSWSTIHISNSCSCFKQKNGPNRGSYLKKLMCQAARISKYYWIWTAVSNTLYLDIFFLHCQWIHSLSLLPYFWYPFSFLQLLLSMAIIANFTSENFAILETTNFTLYSHCGCVWADVTEKSHFSLTLNLHGTDVWFNLQSSSDWKDS